MLCTKKITTHTFYYTNYIKYNIIYYIRYKSKSIYWWEDGRKYY